MRPQTMLLVQPSGVERRNLETTFLQHGLGVISAEDSQTAMSLVVDHGPDVVLIDQRIPPAGALHMCRQLRAERQTARLPVLIFSETSSEVDRVAALEAGADDLVTYPIAPREVVARVGAMLRRSSTVAESTAVVVGKLFLDSATVTVKYDGQAVGLTATEFRILQFLALVPGRVQSRQAIAAAMRELPTDILDRTIDVHVKSIRRKLGPGGAEIETVRGFGYRLRDPNA